MSVQWILASRPPRAPGLYLVAHSGGRVAVANYTASFSGSPWCLEGGYWIQDVTHWTVLPQPPVEAFASPEPAAELANA